LTENKKIIKGYLTQANLVNRELTNVIEKLIQRRESVVVEGVHLTSEFIKTLMMKNKFVLPFIVYISKAEKHKERFAVRSKLMTLDAKYNKYVEHFENIRTIQNYIVKKADESLFPKIDNNNIDKSLGINEVI
jgi:2-phosphoglycerate kinase